MTKKNKKKSAFTLIEILIAMAIFSFALVLVTGIFSSVLGNQTLTSTSSKVSRENQRIMRQISDDAIGGTKNGKIVKPNGYSNPVEGFLFIDESMRIIDSTRLCKTYPGEVFDELGEEGTTVSCVLANGLVLFSDQGIKIYRFKPFSGSEFGDIEYAFAAGVSDLNVSNSNSITTNFSFKKLNSDNTEVRKLKFWGFGCYLNSCELHPFVQIYLGMQTKDYNKLSPNKRFAFELKTRISKRSYN